MKHGIGPIGLALAVASATLVSSALMPGAASAKPTDTATALSPSTTSVKAPISKDVSAKPLPNGKFSASASQLKKWGGDPRVAQYWTKSRIAGATSLDTPASTAAVQKEVDKARAAATPQQVLSRPVAAKVKGVTPNVVSNFPYSVGKVYFLDRSDGKTHWCTGSAVNSGSRRLVITAGHCVHHGPGGTWHANWVYIPRYYYGSAPRGYFYAASLRTYNDWINYGETGRGFNSDVAFATTYNNASNQRVVDATGGNGTYSGGSYNWYTDILGYPGNLSSGEVMYACWGNTGTRYVQGYYFPSISGCNFGGGSSGGPWMYGYNNSSGLGYVRSVTSHGPVGSTAYIDGPYLDSRFPGLFAAANADGNW